MGYYKRKVPGNSGSFNSQAGFRQSNPKNVDGNSEDLSELFWKEIRKRRTFHQGQEEVFDAFFNQRKKYIFERIGRKGAKTATNITVSWGYALSKPNRTIYIVCPTVLSAEEIYWDENRLQWCDLGNRELCDMFVKSEDRAKKTITFVNGSMIKLLGTWSEARSRGTQPDLFVGDEIQDCSADYLDAMEPNLAAKEDARCLMTGTPPKKKNHYHEWEERIRNNPEGVCFHYSSYVNTCLPHLKGWLDNKRQELIKAGKEDIWLREYMAEDCFSSDERVLPDAHLVDHDEMVRWLRNVDASAFKPTVGLYLSKERLTICYGVGLSSRFEGWKFWVLEMQTVSKLWNMSYKAVYSLVESITQEYGSMFPQAPRMLIHDETDSFTDVIGNVTKCRTDIKWKNRGIPLLKEMTLTEKMQFSTRAEQFAVESQNLLKEDDVREYPTVCALAMLANEYYQGSSLSKDEQVVWDQFAPLREAGIVCYPSKRSKSFWKL